MVSVSEQRLIERPVAHVDWNEEVSAGIYKIVLSNIDEIVSQAKAGQFINLYSASNDRLLPRPISICNIDKEQNTLTLIYAVVGKGTEEFARLNQGDKIEVLGPFGNGFPIISDGKTNVIVGGGVGTPPLLQLAKELKGNNHVFVGYRREPYLIEELKQYATVHIATDDGSHGFHGNTVELLRQTDIKPDRLFACGPEPMLRALQNYAKDKGVSEGYFSLEERMGCGFGACVGCVARIRQADEVKHKRVCREGPVFNIEEVVLDA